MFVNARRYSSRVAPTLLLLLAAITANATGPANSPSGLPLHTTGFVYRLQGNVLYQYVQRGGRMVQQVPLKADAVGGDSGATGSEASNDFLIMPGAKFLYVSNNDHAVLLYRVRKDGRLTPLKPATVPVNSHPEFLPASPDHRFLYVSCSHGAIDIFRIAADGHLTETSDSSIWSGGKDPSRLHFSSDGQRMSVQVDDPAQTEGKPVRITREFTVSKDGVLHPLFNK